MRISPRWPDRPGDLREWAVNSGRPWTWASQEALHEQRRSRALRISSKKRCSVSLYKIMISVLPFVFMWGALKGNKKCTKVYNSDVIFSSCCFQGHQSSQMHQMCGLSWDSHQALLFPSWKCMPAHWGDKWWMSAIPWVRNYPWCRLLGLTSPCSVSSLST